MSLMQGLKGGAVKAQSSSSLSSAAMEEVRLLVDKGVFETNYREQLCHSIT